MPTTKPNVLLILTDQQRWDCVGVNGNPLIRTPHLDGLARDGVTFVNSFTSAMACVPSRACIMTGQHVHTHCVTSTNGQRWVQPGTPTLPGEFSRNGYTSVGVGKMHFKPWYALSGFDRRVIIESKYDVTDGQDEYRMMLRERGQAKANIGHHTPGFGKAFKSMPTTELPAEYHIDGFIGRRGLETLELLAEKSQPFFLTVSFCSPHDPYDPPAPYDTMYDQQQMPTGRRREGELDCLSPRMQHGVTDMGIEHLNLLTVPEEKKREVTAFYYGNCTLIDDYVGRLLDALKRRGLYDNTIIAYTSDHGEYLGDHNLYYKGYFPCDSDSKVPLILKAPGVAGGGKPEAFTGNVDLMPTLLDAAGLPTPESCQGASLLPAAGGEQADARDCAVTYSEAGPCYRIRTADWACVFHNGDGGDQLYHLPEDPYELYNLADDAVYAPVIGELRNRLLGWFANSR